MIDLNRETPVTFAAAPQCLPDINAVPGMVPRKRVHERTIRNWATRGKRGVVLEAVPIGGILVTTQEAIQRFFARLAVAREQRILDQDHDQQHTRRRSARRRNKDIEQARAKLASEHGV
jgi:hypothetical protein